PQARRALRARGRAVARLRRARDRHRHGQVGAHRPQDRRDPGVDRNPPPPPASCRGGPRRSRGGRSRRSRARALPLRRDPRGGGRVIVTGMGKSGLIGRKIAATLASTGTPAHFLHPAEGVHGDLGMVARGDLVLALSNSGETDEVLAIIPPLKRLGVPIVLLTGNPGSSLARQCEVVLDGSVPEEACPMNLAPTSSTTATLAVGDALALALLELRGFRPEDYAALHPRGSLGWRALFRVADLMLTGDAVPVVSVEAPLRE